MGRPRPPMYITIPVPHEKDGDPYAYRLLWMDCPRTFQKLYAIQACMVPPPYDPRYMTRCDEEFPVLRTNMQFHEARAFFKLLGIDLDDYLNTTYSYSYHTQTGDT